MSPLVALLLGQEATYEGQVRPFLQRHCSECHGVEKSKADLRLDKLSPGSDRDKWMLVLERLKKGEMPPAKKPRPPEQEVLSVVHWIEGQEAARRAALGRVVLRRLNRIEYTNTVRDLLGVDADFKELLALDSSMDGFDNVGAGLHLSSFAMERYLAAADVALSAAIADHPAPAVVRKRFTFKDSHQVQSPGDAAFRVMGDTVVCFTSDHWHRVHLMFSAPHFGLYRYRLSVSSFQNQGRPMAFDVSNYETGLVGYYDAPADTPTVIEFTARGERNGQGTISILPYGLGHPKSLDKMGVDKYEGPGLAIHWVDVEGPLFDSWPPASHREMFGDLPQAYLKKNRERLEVISKDPLGDAERILRRFVRRAFRRNVADAEIAPYLALVRARIEERDSFEGAVRVGLSGVLTSPRFLFLDERPGRLDDWALASRLSYFLWSTMPDAELLALADQGKLGQPPTLRAQVDRMLRSPKSAAFTSNFLGQWLALRDIDFTAPNHQAYPEFDQMLKVSMVKETELFFEELLRNDLGAANLIDSDFSILNGRLASHYGISGVEGLWEFRKTPLPKESHRGGVLTMASVLKVTANGTSTSPVLRGAWVLDRILGTPPPRPPAGVSALEPDIRGATTVREQLAKHRNDPVCATCHSRIDPPGFALESFDVIGGWRTCYRLTHWVRGAKEVKGKPYLEGPRVDSTGETADGRPFENIDEFKKLLLRDVALVAKALTRKLVTYATGAAPDAFDEPGIEAIVAKARERDYGLRTLIHEIVQSHLFRNK